MYTYVCIYIKLSVQGVPREFRHCI